MIVNKQLFTFTLAAAAALTIGCSRPAASPNSNSGSNANATMTSNSAAVNAANSAGSTASTDQSANPSDSPSATYRAAYTARKNKDTAALKKLLSKVVLDFLTMIGGADPKKKMSLDDMLKDMCERPQASTAETRNEKIEGDKAHLEYLDEDGKWQNMDFIREDGAWKLTIDKSDDEPGAMSPETGDKK